MVLAMNIGLASYACYSVIQRPYPHSYDWIHDERQTLLGYASAWRSVLHA